VKELDYDPKCRLDVKTLIIIIIPSFIVVSLLTYLILVKFDADRTIAAAAGVFSAMFIVYMIMRVNGIKLDFKFKGLGIEAELKENIKNIQTEVKNTKEEFIKQMGPINQNITKLTNSIQQQNIQKTDIDFGDMSKVIIKLLKMVENQEKRNIGIDKSTVSIDLVKRSKAKEELKDIEEIREGLKKFQKPSITDEIKEKKLTVAELVSEGNTQFYIENYEKAVEFYDKAFFIDPKNMIALCNKGIALKQLGRLEDAIKLYDQVLENEPKNVLALNSKAASMMDLGFFEDAIKLYDQVLEIDSKDIIALSNKALNLARMGNYKDAIQLYDQALEINSEDSSLLINKGVALDKFGHTEDAIKLYDQVLESDNKNSLALMLKANVFARQGNTEQAMQYVEKVLDLNHEESTVLYNIACTMSIMNKSDQALDFLEQALQKSATWKISARNDKDFDNIKHISRFQKLVS